MTGGVGGVGVWRVEDGKQMATVDAWDVLCLAVSKDGRWIAAGTLFGDVFVWDAQTYENVIWYNEDHPGINRSTKAVDFSPDSTRVVSASKDACIWDIATCQRVQTLAHGDPVRAAKYSPQGDRIATATENSVRVWDSNNGHLLVDIKVIVTPWYNAGLLWFNNNLFVISDSRIKQFEVSTGSAVSEWPVPDSIDFSCIALPKHGEFVAYSTLRTVTFSDTTTHTQLGLIQHPQDISSIAVSPDDRFLAIGREDGKITINSLSHITVSILSRWIVAGLPIFVLPSFFHDSIPLSRLYPACQEPDIRINDAALHSWKHNQLANAEVLLTAEIHESRNSSHHALASRALVRARLRQWDAAIADATEVFAALLSHALSLIYIKSIEIQPSVIGYIAKSVAHVGDGGKYKACRACDIALQRFHSTHVTFVLLIKVCIPSTRA